MGGIVVFSDPYTFAADLRLCDQSTADKEPRIRPCPIDRNQQATEVQAVACGRIPWRWRSGWRGKMVGREQQESSRSNAKREGYETCTGDKIATEAKRRGNGC